MHFPMLSLHNRINSPKVNISRAVIQDATYRKQRYSQNNTAQKKRRQTARERRIMEKICYCFNYTAADLEKDVMQHGRSTIMERIIAESKQGNCDCKNNNPKGR